MHFDCGTVNSVRLKLTWLDFDRGLLGDDHFLITVKTSSGATAPPRGDWRWRGAAGLHFTHQGYYCEAHEYNLKRAIHHAARCSLPVLCVVQAEENILWVTNINVSHFQNNFFFVMFDQENLRSGE